MQIARKVAEGSGADRWPMRFRKTRFSRVLDG